MDGINNETEYKTIMSELNRNVLQEIEKTNHGLSEQVTEEGGKEVEVELGDEKFQSLKDYFRKFAVSRYLSTDALVETAKSLGIE